MRAVINVLLISWPQMKHEMAKPVDSYQLLKQSALFANCWTSTAMQISRWTFACECLR